MASKQQKEEARAICKEFLDLNRRLGFYKGKTRFYNHKQRRYLIKHGLPSRTSFGSNSKLLSIEEAKKLV